jgi:uncharacterized membrane protein YeiH
MEGAELVGTVVFAISGVIAVAGRPLDWFGAIVVGAVTALGGGTIRGLILGATPVFWIEDQTFLLAAVAGAVAAIPLAGYLGHASARRFEESLQLADAAGLALFTIVGADVALELGFDGAVAVVAGLITGVAGGVMRDVLASRTPLVMSGEIYATAALLGAVVFVGLDELTAVNEPVSATIGGLTILALRVIAIRRQWSLPAVTRPEAADR